MAEDRNRVSRRDVLRGAGAAAFLGSIAPALQAQAKGAKGAKGIARGGPGAVEVGFTINGERRKLSIEPRVTLLDALRDRLELTGSKRVCDRGSCGACTVWVDGKTCNACMMLAVDVQGAAVTTIEGLANGDKLHPIQEAFIREDALQCGFCTPGMIMSCAALHERKLLENMDSSGAPYQLSLEEIKDAISGNLCRCGTYTHIFNACRGVGR